MRVSVVIPCLNEAETIAAVVREAHAGLAACGERVEWSEVVVSDNGSTDGSQAIATEAGARVIEARVPGYGAAVHCGTMRARGDVVLTADADKSHDLMLLPRFVETMERARADLLLGSRLAGEIPRGAMPFMHRYVGTPAINLAIRVCVGLRTSDCNSGMRMVRREFYRTLSMRSPGMEYSPEILVKTAIRGGRYAEIPIHVRPDARGRPPHLRPWRDGARQLRLVLLSAPSVSVLAPAALVAICGLAALGRDALTGCALLWLAYALVLVGIGIKRVRHTDGDRPSRLIAALLASHTTVVGVCLAIGLAVAGATLLAAADSVRSAAGGTILLAGSGVTALAVLRWKTSRPALPSRLDDAWTCGDQNVTD